MEPTTRVDLHCHSTHSDGVTEPREVAAQLAAESVAYAALTDHDTVDGITDFREALARQGVGFLTGLEMTAQYGGVEIHDLAYGFDSAHPELTATLASLRSARQSPMADIHSISEGLRRETNQTYTNPSGAQVHSAAPSGTLCIADAIALIHRAGGRAVLAHPLVLDGDLAHIEERLIDLRAKGLDGVEVFCPSVSDGQRAPLLALCERLGLLVTGGSDAHERCGMNGSRLGVDVPSALWKQFRDAVCSSAPQEPSASAALPPPEPATRRRHFVLRILGPALLAMALFGAMLFAVLLPTFERSLVDRKREMIRELTNSAWSILAEYEREERAGLFSREEAQGMAASRIEFLRYGSEGKDYFWLQDMQPRIIMHPYRTDLNGQDVSELCDARGVRIFVAFADIVQRQREGYVDYVWQWNDDPTRLAAKESYVKGFAPWGWIIGTGVYVEDVNREASRIQGTLVHTSLGISLVVALLLLHVIQQSLRIERERSDVEERVREWTERYRALADAAHEGSLLALDGRCRYANPMLLGLVGRSAHEISLTEPEDILPRIPQNAAAWASLQRVTDAGGAEDAFDGVLQRRDGTLVDCLLAASSISVGERRGFILLVKSLALELHDLAGVTGDDRLRRLLGMADSLPIGLLRARASGRGAVLLRNSRASELLSGIHGHGRLLLRDLFPSNDAFSTFMGAVSSEGMASAHVRVSVGVLGLRALRLDAVRTTGDLRGASAMDVAVVDVTDETSHVVALEAEVARMHTSLLFLNEPIGRLAREAVFCSPDTCIASAASAMASADSSAALVRLESQSVIGIVTDSDIHRRAVAAGLSTEEPLHKLMTAPLHTIRPGAGVYEALMLMEEHGIAHLPVQDGAGNITGVVRSQDLLRFESYGPLVLRREVERAKDPDGIVAACRRVAPLAHSLLNSGAHAERVSRMLSSVCDGAVERLVELAQDELGSPPGAFVVLALGSHGREEITLTSDQDNAIIYADPPDEACAQASAVYFGELGLFLNTWLERAGYDRCKGGIMASNAHWRQPLHVWLRYHADWVGNSDATQVLEFAPFFDLRPVVGDVELVHQLRSSIGAMVRASESFLPMLATQALAFRPPTEPLLRRIMPGRGGHESGADLDLKDALSPIVGYARLYALRHGLAQTHTLDRLSALADIGALPEQTCRDSANAFGFLLGQRLRHQAQQPRYSGLGHTEQALLDEALAQIAAIQERMRYDFLGGLRTDV